MKTKKTWLTTLILANLTIIVEAIIFSGVWWRANELSSFCSLAMLFTLVTITFSYAVFFCSYKNHGTKLLTLSVTWIFTTLAICPVFAFYSLSYTGFFPPGNEGISFIRMIVAFSLLSQTVWTIWAINSLKLRKLNLENQLAAIRVSKHHRMIFESLENVQKEDELEKKFSEGLKQSPKVAKWLRRAYLKKKLELRLKK